MQTHGTGVRQAGERVRIQLPSPAENANTWHGLVWANHRSRSLKGFEQKERIYEAAQQGVAIPKAPPRDPLSPRVRQLIEVTGVAALLLVLVISGGNLIGNLSESRNRAVCATNLLNIGRAVGSYLQDYLQDNDERFYPKHSMVPYRPALEAGKMEVNLLPPGVTRTDVIFTRSLESYTKDRNVFCCASSRHPCGPDTGSYIWNAFLHGWCNDPGFMACSHLVPGVRERYVPCACPPLFLSQVPHRETTPIAMDGGSEWLGPDSFRNVAFGRGSKGPADRRVINFISEEEMKKAEKFRSGGKRPWQDEVHGGGANVLFVDGYVKWHRPKDFRSDSLEQRRNACVETASCWGKGAGLEYPPNDGRHPWFKP